VSEPELAREETEALALAARAGIHALPIPTPFLVGRVNCYLIEDEPLTLVDTGPNSGTALDALERALAEHGRAIEDLQMVVLTHQHIDHTGLLEIISRRSGAQVAAFAPLAPWLADYTQSAADDDLYAQEVMRRHGVPDDLVAVLGVVGAALRPYGSRGTVTLPLLDGDTLSLREREFAVLHRPGHSPSDLVFLDERRGIALAGDHLLARISSNPIIARPLLAGQPSGAAGRLGARRGHPLIDYMASLRASAELPADVVLGGHGDPVVEHAGLIAERLRLHERRARKIERILKDGPMRAHQIAVAMWGNVAVTQAFLTLSEVLGHLDVLLAEGRVVEHDDGERSTFEAA
jgi:glyoxylase-like metal-dependent hydrolase (beta-lactamase superfamily II)